MSYLKMGVSSIVLIYKQKNTSMCEGANEVICMNLFINNVIHLIIVFKLKLFEIIVNNICINFVQKYYLSYNFE
jgi:hypothetical protein